MLLSFAEYSVLDLFLIIETVLTVWNGTAEIYKTRKLTAGAAARDACAAASCLPRSGHWVVSCRLS